MKKAILYVHGKGGSSLEAEQYKEACHGFEVVGAAYQGEYPWVVRPQLQAAYGALRREYSSVSVIANSIGAYFTMLALQGCEIERAFFISPVLDMERLILDMMGWAQATEEELREKGEIPTDFGETLSWDYLCFVRENPICWDVPTSILYAEHDQLIARDIVESFAQSHHAALAVMAGGEHWFHTEEQLAFLRGWLQKMITQPRLDEGSGE